jgi:hypothetical protein
VTCSEDTNAAPGGLDIILEKGTVSSGTEKAGRFGLAYLAQTAEVVSLEDQVFYAAVGGLGWLGGCELRSECLPYGCSLVPVRKNKRGFRHAGITISPPS